MKEFEIQSRRYTGNKYKLMEWIESLILKQCKERKVFFDVFGGSGSVTNFLKNDFDSFIINDFLYSNNVVYNAFFSDDNINDDFLKKCIDDFNKIDSSNLPSNYVSDNYGDKFFGFKDAKKIGFIRQEIKSMFDNKKINKRENDVLIASLLYSMDRIANTCGHYDAYIKKHINDDAFEMSIIDTKQFDKPIEIFREDSNLLARKVCSSVAYLDPPYNSRQYSRFYHVWENITKWEKPELYGTAMKPKPENMSKYCCSLAKDAFKDLVENLKTKYIVVSYNNTYTSKSSSSKNKITLNEIEDILKAKGKTRKFSKRYNAFNAGKTDLSNHQEIVFITEVENENAN